MRKGRAPLLIAVAMAAGAIAAAAPRLVTRTAEGAPPPESTPMAPAIGMPGSPPTTPAGLQQRIASMETRLRNRPDDVAAAVLLADALLRQARATSEGRHANRAAAVLDAVLNENPGQYDSMRLLGAVRLSQHRFRDALAVARRARDARPGDAWNYGVIGDASIELGDYATAFAAFDRMVTLRPSADAYARVSYARELSGDVAGALDVMRLAADATSGHDVEAKAWYTAQSGELLLKLGRTLEAEREFRRAAFFYPDYPHARIGLGKARVAAGDSGGALEIFLAQLNRTPTLDLAARAGDLYAARGDLDQAEHYYALAETLAGPPAAQTEANLALFLADRNRNLDEAMRIAEAVAANRSDIFTDDALAWTLYKNGRAREALAASGRALRTGTRDERILDHAAEIHCAVDAMPLQRSQH